MHSVLLVCMLLVCMLLVCSRGDCEVTACQKHTQLPHSSPVGPTTQAHTHSTNSHGGTLPEARVISGAWLLLAAGSLVRRPSAGWQMCWVMRMLHPASHSATLAGGTPPASTDAAVGRLGSYNYVARGH